MKLPLEQLKSYLEEAYVESEAGYSGHRAKSIKAIDDNNAKLVLAVLRLQAESREAYEKASAAEFAESIQQEERE